MHSAEKAKSAEINHRAWLDKKENLTLLTEATKSHQAELLYERRRLTEEISVRDKKLSAERLLRTYLQQKYEKKLKKEIERGIKKRNNLQQTHDNKLKKEIEGGIKNWKKKRRKRGKN